MKTKTTRRLLALVFVLALMMQIALPASAATRTWTSGGVTYTGTVTKSGTTTRWVTVPGTSVTHGSNGLQSVVVVKGTKTITCSQKFNFPTQHQSQLVITANAEGLYESHSVTVTYPGTSFVVPATAAAGVYAAEVQFTGYKGNWNVSGSNGTTMSGNITIAPYSCNTSPRLVKVG